MGEREPVDKHDLLKRVAQLEITSWSYRWEDRSVRHIGPMAQDFHAAFGVGESDRRISLVDGLGVAMAAIQALYELSCRQDDELAELRERINRLADAG
jgi:hypothetical protein